MDTSNIEAEKSALGAALLDPDAVSDVLEHLTAEDFHEGRHSRIFTAIAECHEAGTAIEPLTVEDALRRDGGVEAAGGPEYLRELLGCVASAANVEEYIRLVHEASVRRRMKKVFTRLSTASAGSIDDLMAEADRQIRAITDAQAKGGFVPLKDGIQSTLTSIEALVGSRSGIVGISSGYGDLDRVTGGFRPGELIILAGRPSTGKTTLALNIELITAMNGHPIGMFSIEMTREQITKNLISIRSGVCFHKDDGVFIEDEEWKNIFESAGEISNAPIYVDDSDFLPIGMLRARARRLAMQEKIKLIVIDYLTLIRGQKAENRQQEVADISRQLKGVAKECGVPVLCLAQLNRDTEKSNRHPLISDLRESGAIEQDADIIILLSREDIDNQNQGDHTMRVNVAKNRNGKTGVVQMQFFKERLKFAQSLFPASENTGYNPI